MVGDVHSPHAWAALLAISPFAGVLVAAVAAGRRFADALLLRRAGPATVSGTTLSALLWASLLFLASQGVWNLAPVVATGRSTGMLDAAAGYAATFVLLRAPVMVFPAIQALVLPRLVRTPADARPHTTAVPRARLTVGGVVLAVVWIGAATALVPLVVDWLFTTGEVPPRVMIAVLSVAILLGTVAQFTQAALVAAGRTSAVALVWLASLIVLLGVAALPVDVFWAATSAQLAATTVALVAMLAVLARGRRT